MTDQPLTPDSSGSAAPISPVSGTPVYDAHALPQGAYYPVEPPQLPPVFITWVLIAINLAVFVLMVIRGAGLMDPSIDSLLKWGADFGPLTTHGQWWRMLTSTFVHVGILHIAMNMYILLVSGPFVERLYGNVGFAVVYILSGLGGSLVSLAWHPMLVSAGASGAIFGVYGALLAFLLMQRDSIQPGRVGKILTNAVIFVGYNLAYGAGKSNIDMGAHLGGIAAGFVVGCFLAQPLTASRESRVSRAGLVLAGGLALVIVTAAKLPAYDELQPELQRFAKLETESIGLFSRSVDEVKSNKLSAADFDDLIEKKILPPWNSEMSALRKLRLTPEQNGFVDQLTDYMKTRAEAWEITGRGVRADDVKLVEEGNRKQQVADSLARDIK